MVVSTSKPAVFSFPPIQPPAGSKSSKPLFPNAPILLDVGTIAVQEMLDRAHGQLMDSPDTVPETMLELMDGLHQLRSHMAPEVWADISAQCVSHPVRELIHQDPFSSRSFNKPRGYAGDAVLIDYIYSGHAAFNPDIHITPLGERLFQFNYETPACAAVRARRDVMASMIDEMCTVVDHPQMLSVACGHLREAAVCRSVVADQAGRFVALDQDELSLAVLSRTMKPHGVVPVCSSIKSLFRGDIAREQFDFIYSTGLYDYLDERIATKLTSRLFGMLNPGGRLLVANFLPDIHGAAYMETFMDWKLIYRTPQELDAVAGEISDSLVASRRTFIERNRNIVFLDLVRR